MPLTLHVQMVSASMDFSTYGYGKISVNGKLSFDSAQDLTQQELYDGQVIFNAFDQDGDVIFKAFYMANSTSIVSSLKHDLDLHIPKVSLSFFPLINFVLESPFICCNGSEKYIIEKQEGKKNSGFITLL